MKPLGRLERVYDLREVWASESGNFTPWLAQPENLELLGETIGIELELEATEKYVGPYRADIRCKDTASNEWVIIENQIEKTDHSHLGQIMTYAAGLDAKTIVWIADRFTDEHRAALDWLNEVTTENINFFGLEIQLWRIGESQIAPKFNVISQPNDWTRTVAANPETGGAFSSTQQLQLEYWTALKEFLLDQRSILRPQKPLPQGWVSFPIGRTNFHLDAALNTRDKVITVSMVILGPNKQYFYDQLLLHRQAIEAEIGTSLEWRPLLEKKSSDVRLSVQFDPFYKSQWPVQFEWLRKNLESFHTAFSMRIKSLSVSYELPGQDM